MQLKATCYKCNQIGYLKRHVNIFLAFVLLQFKINKIISKFLFILYSTSIKCTLSTYCNLVAT